MYIYIYQHIVINRKINEIFKKSETLFLCTNLVPLLPACDLFSGVKKNE